MCFPLLGKAQSLQVCPQCPISTIAQAVAIAKKGDTIEVQKGTYPENNILLDKPLALNGNAIGLDFENTSLELAIDHGHTFSNKG